MNSKERVLCSLAWQEPDRVPVQTYLTPEMEQQLRAHFGRDPLDALSVDLRTVSPVFRGLLKESHDGVTFD